LPGSTSLIALVQIFVYTFADYAISNDEDVMLAYWMLIAAWRGLCNERLSVRGSRIPC
jgi:hypothetical protein